MNAHGHLELSTRVPFLAEPLRVAHGLVVVDAALPAVEPCERQERMLAEGWLRQYMKRPLTPARLLAELRGGKVSRAGRWFVAVRSARA
jgi:hypothetical protein